MLSLVGRAWSRTTALAALLLVLAAAPTRAQAPPILEGPALLWAAGAEPTFGIAVGDVDLDGRLDLVAGNYNTGCSLFLNRDGFGSDADWASNRVDHTASVALGDVDGDGWLDLVCGNQSYPKTCYLGSRTGFAADPVWLSREVDHTSSIALGDIDGDGDLDLVAGNAFEPSEVYLNQGGRFEEVASWSGPQSETSSSIALGDVDGDGDLDLVCAIPGQGFVLHLNIDGRFEPTPAWTSAAHGANAVALADLDGDGDLDLACANDQEPNTVFMNQGGDFGASPTWTSGLSQRSGRVALGDLDNDSRIDLAFSNLIADKVVYRNRGGTFAPQPDWSSGTSEHTTGIALADLDGDGGLDLVCGNLNETKSVYLNTSQGYRRADWDAPQVENTVEVAIGDLNGDGRPDLVCGNAGAPTVVHFNTGSAFDSAAALPLTVFTTHVKLGDLEGDGDLDLVTSSNVGTQIYRNDSGVLAPAGTVDDGHYDIGLGLADVDGDGDLDVVTGVYYGMVSLFLNEGGTFATSPAWTATVPFGYALALGDLTGDGRPDLVVNNNRSSALLFANQGGTFSTDPVRQWDVSGTADLLGLADLDGDHDLDLAMTHVDGTGQGPVVVFENNGGTLATSPTWSQPIGRVNCMATADIDGDATSDLVIGGSPYRCFLGSRSAISLTEAPFITDSRPWYHVALGDLNGDGRVDMACSRYDAPTTVYFGRLSGEEGGGGLPNEDARIDSLRVENVGPSLYRLHFELSDRDSDRAYVVAEARDDFIGVWQRIPFVGEGDIAALPAGRTRAEHSLDWNVARWPISDHRYSVRLKAISLPGRVGVTQRVRSLTASIGILDVQRGTISVADTALVAPRVTLGDTVHVAIVVANVGNRFLNVTGGSTSTPSISLATPVPVSIAPGNSATIDFLHAPVTLESAFQIVQIESDDPFTPVDSVRVVTHAIPITFDSEAITSGGVAPLGQAVTVQAIPREGVRIERASLYYRTRGAAAFERVTMVRGRTFAGVIPGEAVREQGLEYYLTAENSGITAIDPPLAPDSLFALDVAAPIQITAYPQPTSRADFLEGRDIQVAVALPTGADFVTGSLYYRQGGEQAFVADALGVDERSGLPSGTIPAAAVGARGVEYWVEVHTSTRTLTFPITAPATRPDTIQVTVQNLAEPAGHAGGRYRIVSVPLDFGPDFGGTLESILGDQPEFATYDPFRWRAFRYDPARAANVEMSAPEAAMFHLAPGRGFWLIDRSEHRIDTAPIQGRSTSTGGEAPIRLEPGWNQIGDPFDFPVVWTSVRKSAAIGSLVRFDPALGTRGDYAEAADSALVPFEGHFVFNSSATAETLWVPPAARPAPTTIVPAAHARQDSAASLASWQLRLRARTAEAIDGSNSIGVDARHAWELKPPASPGGWVRLGLVDPASRGVGLARRDVRHAGAEGETWEIEVRSAQAGEPITIEALGALPEGLEARLVDRELETSLDLRSPGPNATRIVSPGPNRAYRLVLIAGTADYVARAQGKLAAIPDHLVLDSPAPNPSGALARLRFGMPVAGRATVEVYDVSGARVAVLADDQVLAPGYHALFWDGRDRSGSAVRSGVYFVRITALSRRITTRLVRVH